MEPLPAKKGRYRPPVEEEGSDYDEGGLGAGSNRWGVTRKNKRQINWLARRYRRRIGY